MKNFFTLSLIFSLSFGQVALAQETAVSEALTQEVVAPAPTEVSLVESAPSVPEEPAPQGGTSLEEVVVQDTTNTQDTVTIDVLQGTEDPVELATTTVAIESPATTTEDILIPAEEQPEPVPLETETTLDVVAEDVVAEVPVEEAIVEPLAAVPALSEEDLAPKPEYTFAMTGKKLATKRTVKTPDGKEHAEDVAVAVTPEIDNTTGTMRIGGACDDAYFVVLLFRNQDDYARDPRSYILNKAFPCENKSFSYDISDLPSSLSNGTYYLLVGSQGERGAWTPITGLTEITINRTQL
ncbi:MAG: hypothetical protein RLZZ342_339 [Candidatus Parcubacteria bacterium]|jgi:hypothetical protein